MLPGLSQVSSADAGCFGLAMPSVTKNHHGDTLKPDFFHCQWSLRSLSLTLCECLGGTRVEARGAEALRANASLMEWGQNTSRNCISFIHKLVGHLRGKCQWLCYLSILVQQNSPKNKVLHHIFGYHEILLSDQRCHCFPCTGWCAGPVHSDCAAQNAVLIPGKQI